MAEPQKGPKPKPKDEREQIERFKETARSLGVDESGAEFLAKIRKVVPPRIPKKRA